MVTFDAVVPALVRVCERSPVAASQPTWCVVRDLRGRVRLVVAARPEQSLAASDVTKLEGELQAALSAYFGGPILRTDETGESGRDRRRLAVKLMNLADAWHPPAFEDPVSGETMQPKGVWKKIERHLSKHSWLDTGRAQPPWPLVAQRPAIVTFYSVKGGVGRTTALIACAWQLAEAGRRVAVVDLDLEAPGLGSALEVATPRGRGVLDALVDHLATGTMDLDGLHATAPALSPQATDRVQVFPAGKLDSGYLDKLARLDFAVNSWDPAEESPTEAALRDLLKRVGAQEADNKPDYILLDSRAGLHDLAGLSLHGLAHLDVLFSRASEQAYGGLDLALAVLARRRQSGLQALVVHAMADPDPEGPVAREEEAAFRSRVYDAFRQHVYVNDVYGPDAPAPDSRDAPHWPMVLRRNDVLQRSTRLAGLRDALFSSDHMALLQRIKDSCTPESAAGTGGGA